MKYLLTLLLLLFCYGCSDDSNDKPKDAVSVYGTAAMGATQSGTISIYNYSACQKGKKLAETKLDAKGQFEATIGASENNVPLLIELRNFTYVEQWSDEPIEVTDKSLYSTIVLPSGKRELDTVISYWTHVATALAMQKCESDITSAVSHIQKANDVFSSVLTTDIHEATPIFFASPDSPEFSILELANAWYGIANAAVSSYTYDLDRNNGETTHHTTYNSMMFADTAFNDMLFEGFLNGINADGQMMLGTIQLDADVYRTSIPNHMNSIISHLTNLPEGIDSDSLSGLASKVNESIGISVYGPSEPAELGDLTEPVLQNITVSNCSHPPVGTCCGGRFSDDETIYGNTATITYDVEDMESEYTVSVLHVGTKGNQGNYNVEHLENLQADPTDISIPWRSDQLASVQFKQVSTNLVIPTVTVLFTNRDGAELSVTRTINAQQCTLS